MTMEDEDVRIQVCQVEELKPGDMRRVDADAPIAVYNVDGEFYATADTCTHMESSLCEDGYLTGDVIECGWHMAKFDVRTGKLLMPPGTEPLATFPVEVDGGQIYVIA